MNLSANGRTEAWRIAVSLATFLMLSAPAFWFRWRGVWPSYMPATIGFGAAVIVVCATWNRREPSGANATVSPAAIAVAAAACVMTCLGAWYWVHLILSSPIDPNRADMLPVISAALRRFLTGRDPYTIYHVPWEAPLGYGPVLWAPFLVPYGLQADLRIATVTGALVIPIWCGVAATIAAARGRVIDALLWLALLATILANPDLSYFMTVGHTPVFWPLLPLFAILVTVQRFVAAAFVLGLIVVARTTMAAGVPILFLYVAMTHRVELLRVVVACMMPIVALMLPFAIWDAQALWYGMVAVYPRVIKSIVWPVANEGVFHTIGLTGWLVGHHLERFVELSQLVAVGTVYVMAVAAIRRGAKPLPWMVLAVFAFCMTTLWPLYYIYFDVLMLFVSGLIAETVTVSRTRPLFLSWAAILAIAPVLAGVSVRAAAATYPMIDFDQPKSAQWLYQGFGMSHGRDEPWLPWIWGVDGTIVVPRSSTATADILITAEAVVPSNVPYQSVSAFLNGRPLGTVRASRGWRTLRFRAPSVSWSLGANELKLVCAVSTPPVSIGMSDDPRHLSLAVRRIEVVPVTREQVED